MGHYILTIICALLTTGCAMLHLNPDVMDGAVVVLKYEGYVRDHAVWMDLPAVGKLRIAYYMERLATLNADVIDVRVEDYLKTVIGLLEIKDNNFGSDEIRIYWVRSEYVFNQGGVKFYGFSSKDGRCYVNTEWSTLQHELLHQFCFRYEEAFWAKYQQDFTRDTKWFTSRLGGNVQVMNRHEGREFLVRYIMEYYFHEPQLTTWYRDRYGKRAYWTYRSPRGIPGINRTLEF